MIGVMYRTIREGSFVIWVWGGDAHNTLLKFVYGRLQKTSIEHLEKVLDSSM